MKHQTESTRKEKVYQCVKTFTKKIIQEHSYLNVGLDAYVVSSILKIDRSNASKELNDLWRAGQLIKIAGRPILYLDHEEFIQSYPMKYIPTFIKKNQQISDYLHDEILETKQTIPHESTLDTMIGCTTSLWKQIQNAKAALSYPPHGLPCCLCSEMGVGKLQFAHDMFDYALEHQIFERHANFTTVNCMDYSTTPMLLLNHLVGSSKTSQEKKKKGLIESSHGGMIYFDCIEKLNGKGLEILLNLMSKNTYTKPGESGYRNVDCMLIASTSEQPDSELLKPFISHIPVFIRLPNLEERTLNEKIEHILSYFSNEAKRINQSIRLHRDILACFTQAKYPGNLAQMRSEITLTCSKAHLTYLQTNSNIIQIHHHHLSDEIISSSMNQNLIIEIHELLNFFPYEYILFDENGDCPLWQSMKQNKKECLQQDLFHEELIGNNFSEYIENRLNTFQTLSDEEFQMVQTLINPFVKDCVCHILSTDEIYAPILENNVLLYGLLLHISNTLKRIEHHGKKTKQFLDSYEHSPYEYNFAHKIYTNCTYLLPITIPDFEIENLMQYLLSIKTWLNKASISILVVAHGNHIASEMVAFVQNQCTRCKMEAVDFPSSMTLEALLEEIYEKAQCIDQGSGVLILSDIEPLCSLHIALHSKTKIKSQTLYPLSLPLLIHIVKQCESHNTTLESLTHPIEKKVGQEKASFLANNHFIQKLTDDILSTTLTFINPHKAVDALMVSLNKILADLRIENSDEIIVKFISHCTSMLERVISKEVLSYDKLKSFTSEYAELIQIIENDFRHVDETFGISIPPSELAYISEIFLPFTNTSISQHKRVPIFK